MAFFTEKRYTREDRGKHMEELGHLCQDSLVCSRLARGTYLCLFVAEQVIMMFLAARTSALHSLLQRKEQRRGLETVQIKIK